MSEFENYLERVMDEAKKKIVKVTNNGKGLKALHFTVNLDVENWCDCKISIEPTFDDFLPYMFKEPSDTPSKLD